jgi:4-aminobutyrate aminotransferase
MKNNFSRRELIKSLTAISIGSGLLSWPLKLAAFTSEVMANPKINIKVSPPGPNSLELIKEMKQYVGRTNYTGLYSIGLKGGNGVYLEDLDGNIYVDCLTSASSNLLGYSYDEIARVYYETAVRIQQTAFGYSPNPETVSLAKNLIRITPGNFPKKALIGLSGSDSCEGAIEAARKYSGKMGIISFQNAYHGSTGLSQAASGFRSLNDGIYDPLDPNFLKVPFPITNEDRERVLKNIETILAFGRTAAVLVEIIQGDGGTLLAPENFFPELRDLLNRYDVLLIADEVQSGMGRTGKWWACDHEGIVPDIIVLGKGLSAGYAPVSALIGRAEVIDSLAPASQIFTYMGHPPSTAVASKVIDIIESENLIENARIVGDKLYNGLKEIARKYPDEIVEVRGKGLMIGIEINVSKDALAGKLFAFRCVEKGIYFGYIADKHRVIRVLPPINLTEKEANTIISVAREVAEEMHTGTIPENTLEKVRKYTLGW